MLVSLIFLSYLEFFLALFPRRSKGSSRLLSHVGEGGGIRRNECVRSPIHNAYVRVLLMLLSRHAYYIVSLEFKQQVVMFR